MKRFSIILIAIFTIVACANLSAAGNRGSGGNGGNQNTGVLSEAETLDLLLMREEEKLARDTYRTLYGVWKDKIFLNISRSEQRHMDAMLKMLELYNIEDPVGKNKVGEFTDPDLGDLYLDLVAQGSESLLDAYFVGVIIEELDIKDLINAIAVPPQQPLINSYSKLLDGSYNHLEAFVLRINGQGVEYVSELLDLEDFVTNSGTARMGCGMSGCGESKSPGPKGPGR